MALLRSLVDLSHLAARNNGQYVNNDGVIQRSAPALAENHIIDMIEAGDAIPEVSRIGGGAYHGYTHLSSLLDVCVRQQVIAANHQVPIAESHTGSMKLVFAFGRAAENHARRQIILSRGRQGIYGKWICPCEFSAHVGEYPHDRRCTRCHKALSIYKEPLLVDVDREIVASPDLTTIEANSYFLVVECKSMKAEEFDKLRAPLADHASQGLGYRRMYQQAGFPVLDFAAIVYIRKEFIWGGGRNRVYKEFHVTEGETNRELGLFGGYRPQLNFMWEAAENITHHKRHGTIPRRTVCGHAGCSRAKQCPVAHICFSLPEDAH
jgi:hypothetical protein